MLSVRDEVLSAFIIYRIFAWPPQAMHLHTEKNSRTPQIHNKIGSNLN
jgi:hypothetical protein